MGWTASYEVCIVRMLSSTDIRQLLYSLLRWVCI